MQSCIYLGHHSSPCNDIRLALFPRFSFHGHDSLQQSIEVLICRIIQFLKSFKTNIQVRRKIWWVVISQR